jgi:hypothetical protein
MILDADLKGFMFVILKLALDLANMFTQKAKKYYPNQWQQS